MDKRISAYGFLKYCNGGYMCECYSVIKGCDISQFKNHLLSDKHKKYLGFRKKLDDNLITRNNEYGSFQCACLGSNSLIYSKGFYGVLNRHMESKKHLDFMESKKTIK